MTSRPTNLRDLRASGWASKTVKQEIHANFVRELASGEATFPGLVGYEDTVIPEVNIALLAEHARRIGSSVTHVWRSWRGSTASTDDLEILQRAALGNRNGAKGFTARHWRRS